MNYLKGMTSNVLESAKCSFSESLSANSEAVRFLERCGISMETCSHHSLGVCDMSALSRLMRFTDKELIRSGLVSQDGSARPLYINSIMIPIHDIDMCTIGFIALDMPDGRSKLMRQSVSKNIATGISGDFFGYTNDNIGTRDPLMVVSSPMEVLCMHSSGFVNTLCLLEGTLSSHHVQSCLNRYSAVHYLCSNVPEKGYFAKSAMESSLGVADYEHGLNVYFTFLEKPHRHCNAQILKAGVQSIHDLIDRKINLQDIAFIKCRNMIDKDVRDDRVKWESACDYLLHDLNTPDIQSVYKDLILSKAGFTIENGKIDTPVDDLTVQGDDEYCWIDALLVSDNFMRNKQRVGRKSPSEDRIKCAVGVLIEYKGRAPVSRVSDALGIASFRMRGFISGLKAVLNFDNINVLALEEESETIFLDIDLLISQFKLNIK